MAECSIDPAGTGADVVVVLAYRGGRDINVLWHEDGCEGIANGHITAAGGLASVIPTGADLAAVVRSMTAAVIEARPAPPEPST
jgi:hypothetical protein